MHSTYVGFRIQETIASRIDYMPSVSCFKQLTSLRLNHVVAFEDPKHWWVAPLGEGVRRFWDIT